MKGGDGRLADGGLLPLFERHQYRLRTRYWQPRLGLGGLWPRRDWSDPILAEQRARGGRTLPCRPRAIARRGRRAGFQRHLPPVFTARSPSRVLFAFFVGVGSHGCRGAGLCAQNAVRVVPDLLRPWPRRDLPLHHPLPLLHEARKGQRLAPIPHPLWLAGREFRTCTGFFNRVAQELLRLGSRVR